MNSIDVWNTPLVRNKLEVDEVNNWPHLPRSLAGSQKVVLDLVSNGRQRISIDKTKIGEKHTHKDRAPEQLIDCDLGEDRGGICSRDLLIEPIVEVVSRGSVVDEAEERKGGETLVVDRASSNE